MKDYLRIIIAMVILLLFPRFGFSEIVDGPANVLAKPNGKILFTIKDKQQITVLSEKDGWCFIEWVVDQPASTLKDNNIKPDQALFDHGGNKYGTTKEWVAITNPKRSLKGTLRGNVQGYIQNT